MSAAPINARALQAAREVDPVMLAQALDHIGRTAEKSRSQTRRIRWIAQRAEFALAGREYRDIDVDLPKNAGPDTPEKLQRRIAFHIAQRHELLNLLQPIERALGVLEARNDTPPHVAAPLRLQVDAIRSVIAIAKITGEAAHG